MLEELFTSVIATEGIAVSGFLTCLAGSLVLGAILAFVFTYRSKTDYTKSFVGTLLILPAVVAIVRCTQPLGEPERARIGQWLRVRLGVEDVTVIASAE